MVDDPAGGRTGPDQPRRAPGRALRLAVLVIAYAVGALFAIGAGLGTLFEVQGFGTPSGGPRRGYIALQAVQLLAAFGVPVVLTRVLLPGSSRWWLPALGVIGGLAVGFGLLGIAVA